MRVFIVKRGFDPRKREREREREGLEMVGPKTVGPQQGPRKPWSVSPDAVTIVKKQFEPRNNGLRASLHKDRGRESNPGLSRPPSEVVPLR